jgi:hypothetical protein
MSMKRKSLTPKEVNAKRENARHSTGPRTEAGKARVSMNALKYGLYCDKHSYQCMVLLGEDPAEYLKILNGLIDSLQPQNENQHMMVEDLAILRWERCRNQRGQAGLIAKERKRLEIERRKVWLQYGSMLPDALQKEVNQHGNYALPDSPGKFEDILLCLSLLIGWVQNHGESDPLPIITVLWGEEGLTTRGADLVAPILDVKNAAAYEQKAPLQRKALLERLDAERKRIEERYELYREEFGELTASQINACFAPKGKTWRLVLRQEWALERAIEKKMRLYWDTQEKDRERLRRLWAERELEYTPEDQAAEDAATRLMAKLTEALHELQAGKARGSESGVRGSQTSDSETGNATAKTETKTANFVSSAKPES